MTEAPSPASPPNGGGGGSGSGDDAPSLALFTFAIDVQIARSEKTKSGAQKMGEPTVRRGVVPTTPLPGEKAPVVTYMGLSPKGRNWC